MVQLRRYYRIDYPPDARPRFRIKKRNYEVIDISEEGVKFCYDERIRNMLKGKKIRGKIMFKSGQSLDLEGKIIRLLDKDIVIKPKENISYEDVIIKEQIYILKNYPLLKLEP